MAKANQARRAKKKLSIKSAMAKEDLKPTVAHEKDHWSKVFDSAEQRYREHLASQFRSLADNYKQMGDKRSAHKALKCVETILECPTNFLTDKELLKEKGRDK